MAQFFLPQKIL